MAVVPWARLHAQPGLDAVRAFARTHALRPGDAPVAVGFSGGADSTALLLAAVHAWGPAALRALHVHHGLQADADRFAIHAQDVCAAWGVACEVVHARVPTVPGGSIEEQARVARYTVMGAAAVRAGCRWLLLGHQADDQVESLLLALLRGAGPKGLAAMPAAVERDGVWLGRPLLEVTAAALRATLDAQGVAYIDDPMNQDPAFRRSRIRHELLPVVARLEPGWARTLPRAAALCAQAAACVDARAAEDLAGCRANGGLRLAALRELDAARMSEVLRAWLGEVGIRASAGQLKALIRQVRCSAGGAVGLRVVLAGTVVTRNREILCRDAQHL